MLEKVFSSAVKLLTINSDQSEKLLLLIVDEKITTGSCKKKCLTWPKKPSVFHTVVDDNGFASAACRRTHSILCLSNRRVDTEALQLREVSKDINRLHCETVLVHLKNVSRCQTLKLQEALGHLRTKEIIFIFNKTNRWNAPKTDQTLIFYSMILLKNPFLHSP